MKKNILLFIVLFLFGGCSKDFDGSYNLPFVYKIDIQQGNAISQDILNKLKVGMNKNQVRFVMGTPSIIDPFHNQRWEYIFSIQKEGGARTQRHITLHFDEEEKLSYVSGDIEVSNAPIVNDEFSNQGEKSIIVKEGEYKPEEKGFFDNLWDLVTPAKD